MIKGFIVDSGFNIKTCWVWSGEGACPYPHSSQISEGDKVYYSDTEDYDTFYYQFLIKANERMVTRDELSVVSVNSGRIVLDNLVKQT